MQTSNGQSPLSESPARIGVFWRLPKQVGFELVSFSRPAQDVAAIGGFKTLNEGHVDLWPWVVKRRSWMEGTSYEQYPRGRVNQVMATGRFIVPADRHFLTRIELLRVMQRFALNPTVTDACTDAHYRPGASDRSTSR